MGAAPILMPRRAPGWPLAATLGVHLLLAWWWLQARPPLPQVLTGLREFVVVPVFTTPEPSAASAPLLSAPASSRTAPTRAAEPKRTPLPAPAAAAPEAVFTAPVEAPSSPPPTTSSEPAADPFAASSPAATPSGESTAARAMREAGAVERALRDGKPAKLQPGDTALSRFTSALESAHNDTSRTLSSESYTTPDGVTIYRFRRGNRVYCRTGGHVRPGIGNLAEGGGIVNFDRLGGAGAAGLVECPAQAAFKRD